MSFEAGYILGHASELALFLYFANTSFEPSKSYIKSDIAAVVGYLILFFIGHLQNGTLSIVMFFTVNLLLLRFFYNLKLKNAVFYSFALDVMSVIGEYMVFYLFGLRYAHTWIKPDLKYFIAAAAASKLIYLMGVLFIKRFTTKSRIRDNETQIYLTLIPLLTIFCLTTIMTTDMNYIMFFLLCTAFLLLNFVTLYTNSKLIAKNTELQALNAEYNKSKAELAEYRIMAEKYESTRIMRHDFHKQLAVLSDLIMADNVKAKEYAKEIEFQQRELDCTSYTDNTILNILLDQKIKECHSRGVEIYIQSKLPSMSFMSDIDIVTVFSNLIDNAIEACEKSKDKEIYLNLYTVNDTFAAIKIENSADNEPIVCEGLLRTQKDDRDFHGIGIKSINNTLKKYNSKLDWFYDKENKIFRTIAMVHIPN